MVLFVTYSGAYGGAERLLLDFATALARECVVACPEGMLAQAARAGGLRVFRLPRRSLAARRGVRGRALAAGRLLGHALDLGRLAGDLEPELVVAWGMRSAIAWTLPPTSRRRPVVFQHNDFLPSRVIGAVVRLAAARANVVTVPSRAVADDLDPSGRLSRRLQTVHPGVDPDRFDAVGTPARPPEVLVLGALTEWKRPDVALEACAMARLRFPDLRMRLVGAALEDDGDRLIDRLRARAGQPDLAGAVEFAGATDDARADLAAASCLLHCATREPFGLAVLEALAAARPAIVPAAAGPAEIVEASCGFLYPPGDPGAAADAIVEVLCDPERAAKLGSAGRARARRHFDRATAQAGWAAAVAPLLRRPRASGGAGSAPPSAGSLAFLTVTHNSAAELRALLASVERHVPGARVVVVDCASEDESVAVARAHGSARVVALEENVGFGRGCNRGMAEVTEPATVLVNPDVELLDDSLVALGAEAQRSDRRERLLAPLVLCSDGSRQDSVHPAPGSAADLVRSLVPPAILPGRLGTRLVPWRAREPRRVGWAVACALVAQTKTLRRLGPFDETMFLYGEDLELGLRAEQEGVETWFWPTARVLHHRAHSTAQTFGGEPFELLATARHEAIERRLGRPRASFDDAAQSLTFSSRVVLKRALGRSAIREGRQLAAVARVWRRSFGAESRRLAASGAARSAPERAGKTVSDERP